MLALSPVAPCRAAGTVGVVLMHGKGGRPGGLIPPLAEAMKTAGFLVETPDMPWSATRRYDRTYQQALSEVDAAFERLKARGATVLVVAGHSLGANAALGYAATRDGLAGVAAIAPGHVPEWPGYAARTADSVAQARRMGAEGRGDEIAPFTDNNQGRTSRRELRASIYLTFFDPDGPAVMPRNAAAIRSGTALLWVVGRGDPMADRGRAYAFDRAPDNPRNLYLEVPGGHADTPRLAADRIVDWITSLAQ